MAAVMTVSDQFESAPKNSKPYVLVVGLGESGRAAAAYLADQGKQVLVVDSRPNPPGLTALMSDHPNIDVEFEALDERWLARAEQLVLSPGLAIDLPIVVEARRRGIEVVGELELFAREAKAPVIAVTGSNGKSTVTSLVAAVLKSQGMKAPAGGNLGPPALDLLRAGRVDAYVVEISSFQIETLTSLRPKAAALLNVSPDHIDRHGTLERYAALKASLLNCAERAVVNFDDPLVRELKPTSEETVPFSVSSSLERGWSVVALGDERWLARDLKPIIASDRLGLTGAIGEANSLAALALAESLGGDIGPAAEALAAFHGLPHRLALVGESAGIRFIDDSKATNVGATVAALASCAGPIVLIAGGVSKGADFSALAEIVGKRVKAVVLLGQAQRELERVLANRTRTIRADTMQAAVAAACDVAESGDTVLLSPACASQDMFIDYKDRGAAFARAVREVAR